MNTGRMTDDGAVLDYHKQGAHRKRRPCVFRQFEEASSVLLMIEPDFREAAFC